MKSSNSQIIVVKLEHTRTYKIATTVINQPLKRQYIYARQCTHVGTFVTKQILRFKNRIPTRF